MLWQSVGSLRACRPVPLRDRETEPNRCRAGQAFSATRYDKTGLLGQPQPSAHSGYPAYARKNRARPSPISHLAQNGPQSAGSESGQHVCGGCAAGCASDQTDGDGWFGAALVPVPFLPSPAGPPALEGTMLTIVSPKSGSVDGREIVS